MWASFSSVEVHYAETISLKDESDRLNDTSCDVRSRTPTARVGGHISGSLDP